jgi:cellulose synthase/poly-beta-1,6-N-acetylglucosamine synthase-like glycosyltransferase
MKRSDLIFARLAAAYVLGGGLVLVILSERLLGGVEAAFLIVFLGYSLYGISFPAVLYVLSRRRLASLAPVASAPAAPGVTVVVPAFDEADVIEPCIEALRRQNHVPRQIIVVNDGSSDQTLAMLQRRYDLQPKAWPTTGRARAAVRGLYQSAAEPRLVVVDRSKGGKARALNAALDLAEGEIFVTVDADTLIAPDGLAAMLRRFAAAPETVAVGGVVVAANGRDPRALLAGRVRLPKGLLPKLQWIEYAINFVWRFGWESLNTSLLLSGSFSAFRTNALRDVGGFDPHSLTEDYEISYRLHETNRRAGRSYRIVTAPDAVAYTLVPATLTALLEQRTRWFQGFLHTLVGYRHVIGRGCYGWLGVFTLPVKAVDALAPAWGLFGYGLLVHSLLQAEQILTPITLAAIIGLRWLSDIVQGWLHLRLNHAAIAPSLNRNQRWLLYALVPLNVWFQRLLWFAYGLRAYWRVLRRVRHWRKSRKRGYARNRTE